ncbi:hypothetical protein F2Q69_00035675 [Brassica cretica]|uniref:Uncharacterized protein n=1 Tax=Brassica cretica TaxID=69181 RepID=A0A8S9SDZ2_BRACR|nr:hypothetical protein F2Q69_00035675 [Brassica cretica]
MSTETLIDAALQTSVDPALQTSIDESTETSIDDTPPEAGKFSLTNHANEEVVLDEQNQFGIYQIDDDTLSELEQQLRKPAKVDNDQYFSIILIQDQNLLEKRNGPTLEKLRKRRSTSFKKRRSREKMWKSIDKKGTT